MQTNKIINYLCEVSSLGLSLAWFGWRGLIIVFLMLWHANTAKAR